MNIFVLGYTIPECAEYHNDKHTVKMPLEYAQMLSTVVRLSGIEAGYKPTHIKHPCTMWAGASLSNWRWLYRLALTLGAKYEVEYKREHKSVLLVRELPEPDILDIGLTPFAMAMPDKYKQRDVVQAYRNYYMKEKRHIADWKGGTPSWWR